MNTKICRVCKVSKQLSAFNKATANKDGYNNRCRECGKKYTIQYHEQQKQNHAQTPPKPLPKLCPRCKVVKSFENFYKSNASRTGVTSFCKICSSIKGKEWNKNNKEKSKQKSRIGSLKRNYGLTPQDYEKMLNKQCGVCCICKTNNPGKDRSYFTVDHCHITGVVRGLLCAKCNCALGLLNDNPMLFATAKNYLEQQHGLDLI
jgi:hypothetical protein